MIDIVTKIHDFATLQGWRSFFGFDRFEHNVSLDAAFLPEELILTFDVKLRPEILNGRVVRWTARAMWMLGRKFEGVEVDEQIELTTEASLDETHQQKWDRRLSDLTGQWVAGVAAFACEQGWKVSTGDVTYFVNLFDTNIDFVGAEITLSDR